MSDLHGNMVIAVNDARSQARRTFFALIERREASIRSRPSRGAAEMGYCPRQRAHESDDIVRDGGHVGWTRAISPGENRHKDEEQADKDHTQPLAS